MRPYPCTTRRPDDQTSVRSVCPPRRRYGLAISASRLSCHPRRTIRCGSVPSTRGALTSRKHFESLGRSRCGRWFVATEARRNWPAGTKLDIAAALQRVNTPRKNFSKPRHCAVRATRRKCDKPLGRSAFVRAMRASHRAENLTDRHDQRIGAGPEIEPATLQRKRG
jgi:hypothetical protein